MMSGDDTGLTAFDHLPTERELASEIKPPAPSWRSAADRQADAASAWMAYIDERIARSERQTLRIAIETVGEVLARQDARLRELEREVSVLKTELKQGGKRLKVVPEPESAMIA